MDSAGRPSYFFGLGHPEAECNCRWMTVVNILVNMTGLINEAFNSRMSICFPSHSPSLGA